jgi:hypothetical protein
MLARETVIKKLFIISVLCSFLFSCALPQTTVKTVGSRPSIAIKDAPYGAILYVDGKKIGQTSNYNGDPGTLTLEPGTHEIRVNNNGKWIHNQTIFVESELKTIVVGN